MRLQNLRDLTPSKPPTSTEGVPFEKDRLPSFEGRAGEGCQAASSTHNAKIAD